MKSNAHAEERKREETDISMANMDLTSEKTTAVSEKPTNEIEENRVPKEDIRVVTKIDEEQEKVEVQVQENEEIRGKNENEELVEP